jgi:hypothetical protein
MKPQPNKFCLEDVLNAYAVEPDHDPETLDRYIKDYPDYAADLKGLSHELLQPIVEMTGPLSAEDEALIGSAWKKHLAAAPTVCADPFAALTVSTLREIANMLGIGRSILMAFRDRKVIFASVPQPFLTQLATALNTSVDALAQFLKLPPIQQPAFSHKADEKPKETEPVTFEQLLIQAGVPEEKRAKLTVGK